MTLAQSSTGVSYTLEGCRNDGSIVLPNGDGDFICPDADYTTGNLGKGWNELDLVPHRATLTAGNSAPATQTYMFSFAADNCNTGLGTSSTCADGSTEGVQGYDYVSFPVLNTALSDASCAAPVSVSDPLGVMKPGIGGETVSVFRDVVVTQLRKTTCVYDFYERLALGSHLYNGSSLHSYLVNPSGDKTVPLPVKDILPQTLRKDMSAVANASVSWDITKNSDQSTESFGDVCAPDAPGSLSATIHVTWTKVSTTSTGVTVTTHVFANNPSSRPITVDVTDVIYQGTTQTTQLSSKTVSGVVVPAHTESEVMTDTVTGLSGNVNDFLNDVATATYTDPVTGFPIPGTTTATAQTQIGTGTVADLMATIGDSESITGDGLTFSVPTPSVGSFLNGYVAGTKTIGPVNWSATGQTDSGSVTFNKTIYLTPFLVTSGVLSDTATLKTTDQSLTSNPVNISFSSTASVTLTVSKSIPDGYLSLPGDTLDVVLHVDGSDGFATDVPFHFEFGGSTTLSSDLPGLTPQMFMVTETSGQFCDLADGCTTSTLLSATPVSVDLSPVMNGDSGDMTGRCSGTASLVNVYAPDGIRATVQKITAPVLLDTDPDYNWSFSLTGPGADCTATAGAGAAAVEFQATGGGECLLTDGTYTVIETGKTGWIEDSAMPPDPGDSMKCSFTVDKIFDDGKTFLCVFHNRKLAHASLFKTKSGVLDTSSTDAFTFQLRQGADLSHVGTILATGVADLIDNFGVNFGIDLTPGQTYQFCEIVMPGWKTSLLNTFVPDGNDPGADTSILCVNFVLGDGELRNFLVDNTPPVNPLSGRTIGFWRNWASCHRSNGKQEPVLDETLVKAYPPGVVLGGYVLLPGMCVQAVNLLSKNNINGLKEPGDPIFNMVAQMVAVRLNIAAGDLACAKVTAALVQANALLIKYNFDGIKHTAISKADQVTINNLGTEFDNYNNDKPSACL